MKRFTITVDENVLDGLRDYFAEGVEILEEDEHTLPGALESVKATLAEIDAAMETLYTAQGE